MIAVDCPNKQLDITEYLHYIHGYTYTLHTYIRIQKHVPSAEKLNVAVYAIE